MSTIHQAVQAMVDNLTTKMTSGTPFTPEEQLLVSKAISALKDNETWEKAVVAVVEEHLDTATASLTSATAAINTSTGVINAQASNLAMIPQMRDDVTKSVANVVPLVKQAVDSGSSIPSRVGVSIVGTRDTSRYLNGGSLRAYSNEEGEALCIPYFDEKSGKLYHAFISCFNASNNYYQMNINFGYWQGEVFTSLYKYNSASQSQGEFGAYSNKNFAIDSTYAVIVPLAKYEDSSDVRMCLIIASSANKHSEADYSWRKVIAVNPDESGVSIYTGASNTACDEGAKTAYHPLSNNYQHLAYDQEKKRLVGYMGSLQYYNRAVGVSTLSTAAKENLEVGASPTFGWPTDEMKNISKYISFTGYAQSGQALKGRFVRSSDHESGTAKEYKFVKLGSGYLSTGTWRYLSEGIYRPVSNNSNSMRGYNLYKSADANLNYSMNTNSMADKATSYLVCKTDGRIVPYQIFYGPNFRRYQVGEGTDVIQAIDVVSVNYCVLDDEGNTVSHGVLPLPELQQNSNASTMGTSFDLLLLPVCFDSNEQKIHFLRGSYEALSGGNKFHMSTLIYKV
ncbi:hypothetical protein NI389_13800 [Pseudoalteromonas xiamenensis]|uniref:hypothetical protein n=1 Tax=Pseudoalteromonas xiamenensis TaxID=882626 RepID=UPI0027E468F4|nr:hypothetical protein [Pseudoalteromonas xiamenensis]WMN59274.1 hypothetical protein NI389_13800 [Pseudoalteromonas xiamenensis]